MLSTAMCGCIVLAASVAAAPPGQDRSVRKEDGMSRTVPENVYRGELVSFPGPWGLGMGRSSIILVSDRQLEMLADPDEPLNLTLTLEKREQSLRQVCERAKALGHRTLVIAFDHFFAQYRPGQSGPRRLMPDSGEYIRRIADIGRVAAKYGLRLELSLLSPLEIGPAYAARTGESGMWMHYRKGLLDPTTGTYSVQLWRHTQWVNNKGPIEVKDAGVRVFAFKEKRIEEPYRVVDPDSIVEVTDTARVDAWKGVGPRHGFTAHRIRVYGAGRKDLGNRNRVLVVQCYRTPEMDYFSGKALPFLKSLVDAYVDAGVELNGLYADEMHIQQDWSYHSHHDHGEFAMRYVSDGLAAEYARRHGAEYRDFAKYLIYFTTGQDDFTRHLCAKSGIMHVFGKTPEDIRRTALFRSRYYRLLQDGVVDLFVAAKRYAEAKMGRRLEARAHATWAESPTCDFWETGVQNGHRSRYEYTPNFVWSCTVHQAASACHDYFKWGDFLTGNGNDHAEGGWLDRNYFGLALACSTGILNEVPHSYAGHWGMPIPIRNRRAALAIVYGTVGWPWGAASGMQHRDVDVMMLYPLDLVAVNERFGSWMTQYGYANQITAAKLLERGTAKDGVLEVAGRRFTTLVTTFEPFPSERLLAMMRELAESGGRIVWSGPPPVLTAEGGNALTTWCALFAVDYNPDRSEGIGAPGREVLFEGALAGVAPQTILTDFTVDRIYPVVPGDGAAPAARVKQHIVATHRPLDGGGSATFLGYRPRDDQSCSLGYETRNWFEVLSALGAYAPTGRFPGVNDNPEHISRTTDYLACRFPGGAVGIARHLRELEEGWHGGFARDRKKDAAYLAKFPPPSEAIRLNGFKVAGREVSYSGIRALVFRVNEEDALTAFLGFRCKEITIDGKTTRFADRKLPVITWAPIARERQVPGGAVLQVRVHGGGEVRIPSHGLPKDYVLLAEGAMPGSRGAEVPYRREGESLVFKSNRATSGKWLYVVEKPASGSAASP